MSRPSAEKFADTKRITSSSKSKKEIQWSNEKGQTDKQ